MTQEHTHQLLTEFAEIQSKSKKKDLTQLNSDHHVIIDMILKHPEMTDKEIGISCGMNHPNMSRMRRSPLFQQELSRRKEELSHIVKAEIEAAERNAQDILNEAATKAANTLVSLTESDNDSVKLKSVTEILNRTGTTGKESESAKVYIQADQLNLLTTVLQETSDFSPSLKVIDAK